MNRIHEIEDTNAKLNADKIEYHQTIENENKELRCEILFFSPLITSKREKNVLVVSHFEGTREEKTKYFAS